MDNATIERRTMSIARRLPARRLALAAGFALLIGAFALPPVGAAPEVPGDPPSTHAVRRDGERVDFTLPPRTGLAYLLVEDGNYTLAGEVRTEGADAPRRIEEKVRTRLEMAERIVRSDETGLRALERTYRTFHLRATTRKHRPDDDPDRSATDDGPPKGVLVEHPLHGKTLRARWKGPDRVFSLDVAKGDAWAAAPETLRDRLSVIRLRYPVLPLPSEAKRVGDKWQMTAAELQDFCGDNFHDGPQPKIEGSSRLALTGFRDYAGRRCAVIHVRVRAKTAQLNHPPVALKAEGECLFDLTHRVAVHVTMKGTVRTVGSLEKGRTRFELDLRGKFDVTASVRVADGAADASGGAVPR